MQHTIDECMDYVLTITRHVRREDTASAIVVILIELGFQVHTDGFGYLLDAILIKKAHLRMRMSAVYDEIIRRNDESVGYNQIEQAIRSAIRNAWKRGNRDIWLYYFSENEISTKSPSNNVFISKMAYMTELMYRDREESYEAE